jgi:adenylate cyclase
MPRVSFLSDFRSRFGAFAARRFPGWAHALRAGADLVPADLVRRAQARQERRMAWWRLLLAFVPLLEAWFDPARGAGGFAWGIVVYALGIVGLTGRRGYDPRWRWGFALGDVLLLQAYATYHLAGLTTAEAAFAYVAAANVVMITNALRLSLPLLWASAAGMLAGYLVLFREGMDDVRVRLGGVMLLLIGLSLATMIVRGQLRLLVEARARARLRRFVSPEVADELERRLEVIDRPVSREVTVLFVDIRGFTPSAETMDATDAVAFLNEFFRRVTDAVFRHGGTIDKYIGDCVMALFGAPLRQPDDAARAVAASLDIVRSVAEWSAERVARGEPPVRVGVGLNTSLVVAGAVGTPQKLEYTVIGDGVNVASRVCSLTKELPAVVLATGATRSRAPDFPWTDLGDVNLRGRGAPLRIHGLVTTTPPSPPAARNG